jgi:uncharacterized repeat protein (TIGR03803 family)
MWLIAAATVCALLMVQLASAEAAKFKVVYNFKGGSDGAAPTADLLSSGKLLYGTTLKGGTYGKGTVFSLDPKSGVEQVLHSFGDSGDATYPMAGLVRVGTVLYGTTISGGTANWGAVFSYDLVSGTSNVVYSFQGGTDGDTPQSGLIEMNGMLYGTTYMGGDEGACYLFGCGTIYSINPQTDAETVLYAFHNAEGNGPYGGLTKAGSKLYGTTDEGGAGNCGVAFVFNPATNDVKDIHQFDLQGDGTTPSTKLIALNGVLYGTAVEGGAGDQGALFGIDRKTGSEVSELSFTRENGTYPEGTPAILNGIVYATASIGGASNDGTVVSLDPATGASATLHAFSGKDGANPWAGLTTVGKHIYGTTQGGGSSGGGVVFEITP